jgi:lipoxygenase
LFHVSPWKTLGPSTEIRPQATNFDIYVPSDEIFSPNKLKELKSNSINAVVHLLSSKTESLPQQSSRSFQSFEETLGMISSNRNQTIEGWIRDNLKKLVPTEYFKEITRAIKENHQHVPISQIIYGKIA